MLLSTKTTESELKDYAGECKCDLCTHGCTMGGPIVLEEEKKRIQKSTKDFDKNTTEEYSFNTKVYKIKTKTQPYGECVYFKNNECSIHKVKPLQCRIATGCKEGGEEIMTWFTVNKIVNKNDPISLREWAFVEKTRAKIPGSGIDELVEDEKTRMKIIGGK